MARIPSYGSKTDTRTPFALTEEARVSVPNVGAAVARGVEDVAAVLQRRADEEDDLWVGTAAADAKAKWTERLREIRDSAEPGQGYAKKAIEEYDEWRATALDEAPSGRARRRLDASLAAYRAALASDVLRMEAEDTAVYRKGRIADALDKSGAVLASKPELFQQVYKDAVDMIRGAGLRPRDREAALKAARKELAKSAVQGLIEKNPGAALSQLSKGAYDDFLDGGTKAALINRAQSEGRSRAAHGRQMLALERAEVADVWRDKVTAYKEGEASPYGPGGEDKRMSTAYLTRLFGPDRAQRMVLALTDAAVAGAYKRELMTAKADEVPGLIQRYRLTPTDQGARTDIAANKEMARATEAELRARRSEMLAIVKSEVTRGFLEASRSGAVEDQLAQAEHRALVAEKLTSLVGADLAGEVMKKIEAAVTAGDITRDVRTGLPKGDALAAIESAVDGLGDEALSKRLTSIVSRTLAEREKGLSEDPASYVLKHSTAVRAARAAYVETLANPGATPDDKASAAQRFAQASIDAQSMMGVLNPRILPKDLADQVMAALRRPGDGTPAGGDKAQIVQGMVQTWGKYWPMVAGQMARNGEGAPELAVLAMVPPGSPIARDASALIGVKTEDLRKGLDPGTTTGLNGYLARNLRDLQASTQFGITDPAYRSIRDATYRLALKYINDGESASAAAEKATKFISDRYAYSVINGATLRIPKSVGEARGVGIGVRSWIANVANIDLPEDWQRLFPKTAEKEARAAYLSSFRANAQPVTGEGDRGFYLMMNGKLATRYGEPIFVDFRAISAPDTARWQKLRSEARGYGIAVDVYLDPKTGETHEFKRRVD